MKKYCLLESLFGKVQQATIPKHVAKILNLEHAHLFQLKFCVSSSSRTHCKVLIKSDWDVKFSRATPIHSLFFQEMKYVRSFN